MSDRSLPPGADGRPPSFHLDGGGDGRPPVEAHAWPADRPAGPEEEIGLDEIWAVLRRRWTWIAGAVALALGAAAVWTWWQVPEWEASTAVRVEASTGGCASSSDSPSGW